MTMLYDARDSGLAARRAPAIGSPATLGESASSAFRDVVDNQLSISGTKGLIEEYNLYLDGIKRQTGQRFRHPLDDPAGGPNGLDVPATVERERALRRQLLDLKATKFPDLPVLTLDDIRARMSEVRAISARNRADVAARETPLGAATAFAAQAGGLLLDPPVLASMVFGAPASVGILRAALIDAGVATAVEVPVQLSVQATRAQLGEKTDLSQATINVLSAGFGAGVFSGAIRAAGKGIKGLVAKARASGVAAKGEAKAAADYLDRKIALDGETPFNPADPVARAEHAQRLSETQAALNEGRRPVLADEPQSSTRPAAAKAPGLRPADPPPPAPVLFDEGPLAGLERTLKSGAKDMSAEIKAAAAADDARRELARMILPVVDDPAALTALVRDLRAPDPKPPKGLTQYLVENGGLKDTGGELKTIGLDARSRPTLVRKNGKPLDVAARDAFDAGFFPGNAEEPSGSEFLDALQSDFSGRRPQVKIEDQAIFEAIGAAESMRRLLDDAGVDLANLSERDAAKRLATLAENRHPEINSPDPAAETIGETRIARAELDRPVMAEQALDTAIDTQVRDQVEAAFGGEDLTGLKLFFEDADGNVVERGAAETLAALDETDRAIAEFAQCAGLGVAAELVAG